MTTADNRVALSVANVLQFSRGGNVLLSVTEAAKKLSISQQRVRVLLAQGRLKGKKVGGTWVVQGLSYTKMRPGRKGKHNG
jgi:excisionase family DNA binding protein